MRRRLESSKGNMPRFSPQRLVGRKLAIKFERQRGLQDDEAVKCRQRSETTAFWGSLLQGAFHGVGVGAILELKHKLLVVNAVILVLC